MNRSTLVLLGFAVGALGCAAEPPARELPPEPTTDALTSAQRRHHLQAIRRVAATYGISNALPLAGLASAESTLQQCDEGTFCPGPWSSDCRGPVMAGGSDGVCGLREGGIGLFQLDGGDYDQTIAREGERVLSLNGNIQAGTEFVLDMLQTSPEGPGLPSEAAAVEWLNALTIDGPQWNTWLVMLTKSYNGCGGYPIYPCDVHYGNYDEHARVIRSETGASFWSEDVSIFPSDSEWVVPLTDTLWRIGFNVDNPGLSSRNTCFDQPFNTLTHAGEDWAVASGTVVHAIGPGTVIYASLGANYPGAVIVVEHSLSEAESAAIGVSGSVYSMYGHLTGLVVEAGDAVVAGQPLAQVLRQDLRLLNDGANSHLHWEIRTMPEVEAGYRCGTQVPGPGYTARGTDARDFGYLDPTASVALLAGVQHSAACDNGVRRGATACNPATPGTEYVCTEPGTDAPWEARACADGWRCVGDHCVSPCDNGVPVGETACAAAGDPLEYVCARPERESAEQWDARACPPGQACQGAGCAAIDDRCGEGVDCPAGQRCQGGRCRLPVVCRSTAGCQTGERCSMGVCQPSQGPCAMLGTVGACDAAGRECAWYFCSESCWPRGTSNAVACD